MQHELTKINDSSEGVSFHENKKQEQEQELGKRDSDVCEGVEKVFIDLPERKREHIETLPNEKRQRNKKKRNDNTNTHNKQTTHDHAHAKSSIKQLQNLHAKTRTRKKLQGEQQHKNIDPSQNTPLRMRNRRNTDGNIPDTQLRTRGILVWREKS